MFNLTKEDLKIAKPVSNILIVGFIGTGILWGSGQYALVAWLQGFFPILAVVFLYYSMKIITPQERSFVAPFFLIASVQSIMDSYSAFETVRQGSELDIYVVGSHFFIGLFHVAAFWCYKSVLPSWGLYASLLGGASQVLAAIFTMLGNNDLHDIADFGFPLIIVFWIALRNAMASAEVNA